MVTSHPNATGPTLAHDTVDCYRALGSFGKPVHASHEQLCALLEGHRGTRYAHYFARPELDVARGEMRWVAAVPGIVRPWHELSVDERADHAPDLEAIHTGLLSLAQDLRRRGPSAPGGQADMASLIEQAMQVPAKGNFLYLVGHQPVLAFWGFEDHDGGSVDPGAPPPGIAAISPASLPPVEAPVPPDEHEPAVAPVPPVAPPRRSWMRTLLIMWLLLTSIWLLPRACADDPVMPPESPAQVPAAPAPTPPGTGAQPDVQGPTPPGVIPGNAGAPTPPAEPGGLIEGPMGVPPRVPVDPAVPPLSETNPTDPQVPDLDMDPQPPSEPTVDVAKPVQPGARAPLELETPTPTPPPTPAPSQLTPQSSPPPTPVPGAVPPPSLQGQPEQAPR
jgi:hypothetical protein